MRSHHLTECGRADALGARSRRRVDRRRLLRKSRVARRRAASCRRRPTFAHGAVGRSMTTTCAPRWPLSSRCATCWKASHMCGEGLPWGDLSSARRAINHAGARLRQRLDRPRRRRARSLPSSSRPEFAARTTHLMPQSALERLVSWATAHGAALHPHLAISHSPTSGHGLVRRGLAAVPARRR